MKDQSSCSIDKWNSLNLFDNNKLTVAWHGYLVNNPRWWIYNVTNKLTADISSCGTACGVYIVSNKLTADILSAATARSGFF